MPEPPLSADVQEGDCLLSFDDESFPPPPEFSNPDQKSLECQEHYPPPPPVVASDSLARSSAAQVVSELFENLKMKARRKAADTGEASSQTTDVRRGPVPANGRSAELNKPFHALKNNKGDDENQNNRVASLPAEQAGLQPPEEDKRQSSGSISSLKKLWETGGSVQPQDTVRKVSPKIATRRPESLRLSKNENITSDECRPSPPPPSPPVPPKTPDEGTDDGSHQPHQQPLATKPVVPTKPALKPSKLPTVAGPISSGTVTASRFLKSSSAQQSTKPPVVPRNQSRGDSPNPSNEEHDQMAESKTSILEISSSLESGIALLKSSGSLSSVSVMQLSDKVQLFWSTCSSYAESIPPHGRFRFRELLSKLETQGNQLRTCSSNNSSTSAKLFTDLHNTVRDLVNVVQR